jgi:ParB family transcriptional regulator, chromosome partitioning protein
VPKKALGKGLEALIPQTVAASVENTGAVHEVNVENIEANPHQPRKSFNSERLKQLSESIREDGLLQPVVVRRRGEKYQLIMGERRLQAARLAGVPKVPVVVKEVKEVDSLRLALVENIQREDLNAIEVALAYRALVATFGLTQSDLAGLIGRDRSSVANSLRLLNLPEEVQQMIVDEQLTGGHARALLALPTQKEQLALARRIVARNLSVRQAEQEAGLGAPKKRKAGDDAAKEKAPHITYLENAMSNHLGTRVVIDEKRGGKGRIAIEFYSHDDFERLAELMNLPIPR